MSREKLLTISVVLLLMLNFGMLGFLLLAPKPRPGGGPPPGRILTEKMQFDEKQKDAFEKLKREHRSVMEGLDEQHEAILKQYFEILGDANPSRTLRDSLEQKLGNVEIRRASATLDHFLAVKSLCRPDQIPRFNSAIPDMLRLLLKPPRPEQMPPPARD